MKKSALQRLLASMLMAACLSGCGCGENRNGPESRAQAGTKSDDAAILTEVCRDYAKFLAGKTGLQEMYEKGVTKAPGGVFERILLRSAGSPALMFLRHDADPWATREEYPPPVPETFRYCFESSPGKWERGFAGFYDNVAGSIGSRRILAGRTEYMIRSYQRGGPVHFVIFTVTRKGIELVSEFSAPTLEEMKADNDQFGEEEANRIGKIKSAPPEGMMPFHPEREWISAAELIASSDAVWHRGEPPEKADQLAGPPVSFEQFKAWVQGAPGRK